jgi:hypothetical protein
MCVRRVQARADLLPKLGELQRQERAGKPSRVLSKDHAVRLLSTHGVRLLLAKKGVHLSRVGARTCALQLGSHHHPHHAQTIDLSVGPSIYRLDHQVINGWSTDQLCQFTNQPIDGSHSVTWSASERMPPHCLWSAITCMLVCCLRWCKARSTDVHSAACLLFAACRASVEEQALPPQPVAHHAGNRMGM